MDKIISLIKRIFHLKDLRDKIIFTVLALILFRVLAHVPLPGVDTAGLQSYFENNQVLGMLDLFSGGSVSKFSLVMLGVGPYITASIVIQLLTIAIPALEQLQKEGEYGREKINQYTRYLSVPLALVEAYGFVRLLTSQGLLTDAAISDVALVMAVATAGSVFLMWLGELISERGIGNGVSLIISTGIIAGLPSVISNTAEVIDNKVLVGGELILLAVAMIAFIVWMNQAERRVPVSYARRARANRTVGVIDSYLPIKPNAAGVIPIIFGSSMLVVPNVLAKFLETSSSQAVKDFATSLSTFLSNNLYYGILFFVLVFLFTFFYTSIIFQPKNMAENLQKQGGFIPGIRPGNQTAQYLSSVIYKITFAGAFFLSVIALSPFLMQTLTGIGTLSIGGTSILIIVSVTLEFVSQIKSNLIMRSYEGFLE